MKKLLLTLGASATAITPLATVIACGDDASISNSAGTLTVLGDTIIIKDFVAPSVTSIENEKYYEWVNSIGELIDETRFLNKITKVSLEGEVPSLDDPSKSVTIEKVIDFADVWDFDNLYDAYVWSHNGRLKGEHSNAKTSAGILFSSLFDGNLKTNEWAQEEMASITQSIQELDLESPRAGAPLDGITEGQEDLQIKYGFDIKTYLKIDAVFWDTDFTFTSISTTGFGYYEFDHDPSLKPEISFEYKYSNTGKFYSATPNITFDTPNEVTNKITEVSELESIHAPLEPASGNSNYDSWRHVSDAEGAERYYGIAEIDWNKIESLFAEDDFSLEQLWWFRNTDSFHVLFEYDDTEFLAPLETF